MDFSKNIYISKDIYEYLTNFADDRTILNMLSVNKKFNDKEFFKRVFLRKYPLLLEFQKKNETLKGLFVRMTYYIAKLEEKYGIPYIPTQEYDPEYFYKTKRDSSNKHVKRKAARWAAKGGHRDIVKLLIDEGADNYNTIMASAAKGGHRDIVQLMLDKGAQNFDRAMADAAEGGHIDIVQLMLDKGADDFNWAMSYATFRGHIDIVRLMLDKGANDFNLTMTYAAKRGHIDIVQLMLDKGANDFNLAMKYAAGAGHIDVAQLLSDKDN
tara:strand:- start:1159 stop:1965 length:807 start_codon:yes stop_codon:yes gene_type:complete